MASAFSSTQTQNLSHASCLLPNLPFPNTNRKSCQSILQHPLQFFVLPGVAANPGSLSTPCLEYSVASHYVFLPEVIPPTLHTPDLLVSLSYLTRQIVQDDSFYLFNSGP
ncbi:hypothetical protein H1C71_008141, partial [Ictidomys tridecemlineatus]